MINQILLKPTPLDYTGLINHCIIKYCLKCYSISYVAFVFWPHLRPHLKKETKTSRGTTQSVAFYPAVASESVCKTVLQLMFPRRRHLVSGRF